MRKATLFSVVPAVLLGLLAGCSSMSNPMSSNETQAGTVPVSISMTDDPPSGVDVLFFQVSLTAASLTPASGSPVSLLSGSTPIQVDVTQLQALSAFLSTANVAAGTYNSLSLTFANPNLVIFNQSDTSIASTCAVGSVCQLTPTVDNSGPVTFSSSPFPVTVSSSSPLGFLVDFHLNTVIQSDLSVNLGVANGITVAELPSMPSHPQFGAVTGTVGTVNSSQSSFTLTTAWGRMFTIDTTSGTTFGNFPASACITAGFGCVAAGQVVQVQVASVASGGVLTAGAVNYVQAASAQTAEGTIIDIVPLPLPAGEEQVKMILHASPNATGALPLGGFATVTFASNATYSIDDSGFTLPSGLVFTGTADVAVGQTVTVDVVPGSLSNGAGSGPSAQGWGPPHTLSFTSDSVELEPSQLSGMVTALDAGASSFTLGFGGGPWFAPWPMAAAATANANALSFNVLTTSQTTYQGFTTNSFDGLATQDFVSVNGWLFPAGTTGGPQIAAQTVVLHPNDWF